MGSFYCKNYEIHRALLLLSLNCIFEAAELRFLRPMAGYTLWDKERSSNIREQLGMFNITDKLTHYKINWREHIQRMDDNRLPKKI